MSQQTALQIIADLEAIRLRFLLSVDIAALAAMTSDR